jgi:hypothetical protein
MAPAVAALRARAAASRAAERDARARLAAAAGERASLKALLRDPRGCALPRPSVDETSEMHAVARAMSAAQGERRRAQEELARVLRTQQREIAAMRDARRRSGLFLTTHAIGYPCPLACSPVPEGGGRCEEDRILLTQLTELPERARFTDA